MAQNFCIWSNPELYEDLSKKKFSEFIGTLSLVGLTRLIFMFVFFLFQLFVSVVFCHFMSKIVFEVVMVCFKRQYNKMKLSKQQQPTIYSLQNIQKHT